MKMDAHSSLIVGPIEKDWPSGHGPWDYWRQGSTGLAEFGTVLGRNVALPLHFHEEDQLTVVIRGRRRFLMAGELRCISAGEAVVIPAGTLHGSLDESDGVLCANFYLAPGCYAVQDLLDALLTTFNRVPLIDKHTLSAVVEAHRRHGCEPALLGGIGLNRIDHLLSVTEAALRAGVSREAYSRRFRKAHGISPEAHRLLLRLNVARHALRAGISPSAASAEAGFADQSHLGRAFRRFFGVSPGQYRKG